MKKRSAEVSAPAPTSVDLDKVTGGEDSDAWMSGAWSNSTGGVDNNGASYSWHAVPSDMGVGSGALVEIPCDNDYPGDGCFFKNYTYEANW